MAAGRLERPDGALPPHLIPNRILPFRYAAWDWAPGEAQLLAAASPGDVAGCFKAYLFPPS